MKKHSPNKRIITKVPAGYTIVELLVVVGLLAALSGVAVVSMSKHFSQSQGISTQQSLVTIKKAIMGHNDQPGYWWYHESIPTRITTLFDHADEGPFLHHIGGRYQIGGSFIGAYGQNGDPVPLDGWGNPIVIQIPVTGNIQEGLTFARLVSAGSNGVIDTPRTSLMPSLAERSDDMVLFLRVADTGA